MKLTEQIKQGQIYAKRNEEADLTAEGLESLKKIYDEELLRKNAMGALFETIGNAYYLGLQRGIEETNSVDKEALRMIVNAFDLLIRGLDDHLSNDVPDTTIIIDSLQLIFNKLCEVLEL